MTISPNILGILLMVLGISLLSMMDACIKWLLLEEINTFQIIALRGWVITFSLLLILPRRGGFKSLATKRKDLHIYRAIFGVGATFCFFVALKTIPLADATAIFFCSSFFMTAGSKYILAEQVGMHRWIAVFAGFVGVLFVTSPGTEGFHPASLLALASGACYAVLILAGRVLTRTEQTFNLVFYFNLANTLIASAIAPFYWRVLTGEEMLMILVVAALASSAYFLMTRAFAIAPVSVIAPIEYIALVWAVLIGYMIWQEIPSYSAWFGMLLIIIAGLTILWRESHHQIGKVVPATK